MTSRETRLMMEGQEDNADSIAPGLELTTRITTPLMWKITCLQIIVFCLIVVLLQ